MVYGWLVKFVVNFEMYELLKLNSPLWCVETDNLSALRVDQPCCCGALNNAINMWLKNCHFIPYCLRSFRQFNREEEENLRHCFTVNDIMFLSNKGIKSAFVCMYLNDVVGLFFGGICCSSHWLVKLALSMHVTCSRYSLVQAEAAPSCPRSSAVWSSLLCYCIVINRKIYIIVSSDYI